MWLGWAGALNSTPAEQSLEQIPEAESDPGVHTVVGSALRIG